MTILVSRWLRFDAASGIRSVATKGLRRRSSKGEVSMPQAALGRLQLKDVAPPDKEEPGFDAASGIRSVATNRIWSEDQLTKVSMPQAALGRLQP